MSVAALALCVGLVACSADAEASKGAEQTTTSSPAPRATTGGDASTDPGSDTADQPVAKIERAGHTTAPTISAEPADTGAPVTYDDGVTVRIDDVSFAKETAQGPGSFPDREYARLTITITNGSTAKIDLGTSVLTLLDASGTAAVRVYAAEAEAVDFAGVLAAGKSATASYAFALPSDARDDVALVVDFDGDHSSAVFRGGLD
ncbi:hypothetical protein [Microbacterium sp. NPDC089695]|uniref:hypothetical protein n=1 Tax=Microbacterium sp. NPDC089695 TaxID=3364198 RepID=UPI00380D52DA